MNLVLELVKVHIDEIFSKRKVVHHVLDFRVNANYILI